MTANSIGNRCAMVRVTLESDTPAPDSCVLLTSFPYDHTSSPKEVPTFTYKNSHSQQPSTDREKSDNQY